MRKLMIVLVLLLAACGAEPDRDVDAPVVVPADTVGNDQEAFQEPRE